VVELLIAVGLNVVHRHNFAEYVGCRAILALHRNDSCYIKLIHMLSKVQ